MSQISADLFRENISDKLAATLTPAQIAAIIGAKRGAGAKAAYKYAEGVARQANADKLVRGLGTSWNVPAKVTKKLTDPVQTSLKNQAGWNMFTYTPNWEIEAYKYLPETKLNDIKSRVLRQIGDAPYDFETAVKKLHIK